MTLDELDRRILNLIQTDFPLHPRPFMILGQRLGLSEEEVLQRVKEMKASGVIRRIGGSFDSRKLGFYSTLCAAKVAPEDLERFNQLINGYAGVTHNYQREHHYNVWFTLIGGSEESVAKTLQEMAQRAGSVQIVSLPARRTFKIRVNFEL
ncbi:MAG: siroheme decarboxylase subunit alpha [Thermodesulfobacteriota bacterium]